MPNYRYRGFDASGTEQEGSVAAANAQDAAKLVASRGIRVRMVQEIKDAPAPQPPPQAPRPQTPPPQAPRANPNPGAPVQRPSRAGNAKPPAPQPQRPAAQAPQQRPAPVQPAGRVSPIQQRQDTPGPLVINVPTVAPKTAVRTPEGTDKDRMFLFSQFAASFRAGIAPADFLQNVALRTRGIYRQSLEKMWEAAREGTPMSNVMELYPDLYPVHVVALTRAGEAGGFVPDAFETIAQQAEQAHKFKRWFTWIWLVVVNAALSVPGILIITRAALKAEEQTEKVGGNINPGDVVGLIAHDAFQQLLWPYGPVSLAVYGVLYILWRLYLGKLSRPFRHQVAVSWPAFGPRARAENMAIFTWTMGQLTKAGIPYGTAWQLAAASAPNDVMARRLTAVGNKIGGEQALSSAMLVDRNLFPPEYANVIGTAEYTGDIPGAMDQIARLSRGEYESAQNAAKIRGGCWGALGCAVSGALVLGLFMYWWFYELPHQVLKDMDPP